MSAHGASPRMADGPRSRTRHILSRHPKLDDQSFQSLLAQKNARADFLRSGSAFGRDAGCRLLARRAGMVVDVIGGLHRRDRHGHARREHGVGVLRACAQPLGEPVQGARHVGPVFGCVDGLRGHWVGSVNAGFASIPADVSRVGPCAGDDHQGPRSALQPQRHAAHPNLGVRGRGPGQDGWKDPDQGRSTRRGGRLLRRRQRS